MYFYSFSIFLLLFSATAHAQSGCTDPAAINYNPTAIMNDGSCIYPETNAQAMFISNISEVNESSGLVWANAQLWTHNDSGGQPEIYRIDTATGQVLQTVVVDNFPQVDWEDIAVDENYIYIAETGNNDGNRTNLKILKIAKTDIGNTDTVHVLAEAINFNYADQNDFTPSTQSNFDCEAITVVEDSILLFSKNWGNKKTKLYKLPKEPGVYSITPQSEFNVACLVTGATYNATAEEITLIGYTTIAPPTSVLWILNDYTNGQVFNGNKRKITLTQPGLWQTEGISYIDAENYFISSETIPQFSIPSQLHRLKKSWNFTTHLQELATTKVFVFPNPALSFINIACDVAKYNYGIWNSEGKLVQTGALQQGISTIKLKHFMGASFHIKLFSNNEMFFEKTLIKMVE